ncbi:MAG: lecithin retinol acyltransferase family protein [Lachnospiraceae bacterium]|nr:lecithin retinol acyltransferase family protein [Lachnospiraceae bacterium]
MWDKSSVMRMPEKNLLYTEIGDCPNVELAVNADPVFWKVIKQKAGWQLQANYVTGLYRVVDENNIRKAWGSPTVMEEKFKRLTREEFLEPGDVIGVARKKAWKIYEHYAVYIGDGQVVHYAGDGNDFSGCVSVRKASLESFLKGDTDYFVLFFHKNYTMPRKIQVRTSFNLDDIGYDRNSILPGNKSARIYSPEETVRRALSRLGEESYHLLSNNCEHFAVWCKTGVAESYQVNRTVNTVLELLIKN